MARKSHPLRENFDLADYFSTGVLAGICPRDLVEAVLAETEKGSRRSRTLPASAVVYYIMSLCLWREAPIEEVFRIICEALSWMDGDRRKTPSISKSAISQARTRLGSEVMRILADRVLAPFAIKDSPGAWYKGFRLTSMDFRRLDLPDFAAVGEHFGYPASRPGEVVLPQAGVLALVETGTGGVIGAEIGARGAGEQKLAETLLPKKLNGETLLLADQNLYGYKLWKIASEKGHLLWRIKSDLMLPKEERLSDGSFISFARDGFDKRNAPVKARVIEYKLKQSNSKETYRLLTNIYDPVFAPAAELAALYHERGRVENTFGEFERRVKGFSTIIRSRTPDLVLQEIWGLLLTHYAIRRIIYQSAGKKYGDSDKLKFVGAVRVIGRKIPHAAASTP
jgi:hypothetical protein